MECILTSLYKFTDQKITDLSDHWNKQGEGENLAMVCLPESVHQNNVITGPDATRIWYVPKRQNYRKPSRRMTLERRCINVLTTSER